MLIEQTYGENCYTILKSLHSKWQKMCSKLLCYTSYREPWAYAYCIAVPCTIFGVELELGPAAPIISSLLWSVSWSSSHNHHTRNSCNWFKPISDAFSYYFIHHNCIFFFVHACKTKQTHWDHGDGTNTCVVRSYDWSCGIILIYPSCIACFRKFSF